MKTDKKVSLTIQMKTGYMFNFLYWHSYHGIQGIINYGISAVAVILLLCNFMEDSETVRFWLIILALLFTVLNPALLYYKAVRQVTMTPMFKKPFTYSFDEQGFTVKQDGATARASWSDVLLIRETGKIIALYMGASNATILPKDQCKENLAELKEFIRKGAPEAAKNLKQTGDNVCQNK